MRAAYPAKRPQSIPNTDTPPRPASVPELRDRWARALIADADVPDAVARTAWALREYVNRAGEAKPSVGRLAADTGKNRRTIYRHLAALVDRGYLERIAGKGVPGPGGRTALTRIRLPVVDNPVDKARFYPQLDAQLVTRAPSSSDTCCHPNPSLNPKSAAAPASQGGPAARDGKPPPVQRELPMLGEIQRADPEHVARALKRIRATLGKSRQRPRARQET